MRARKILRIHRARESGGGEILARISKPGGTTRSSNDSFLGATNNTSHRRNTVRAFDSRIDIEREVIASKIEMLKKMYTLDVCLVIWIRLYGVFRVVYTPAPLERSDV